MSATTTIMRPDAWYALRGGGAAYVTSESRGQLVAFGMLWARPPEGGFEMVEREWQWGLLDGRSVRREAPARATATATAPMAALGGVLGLDEHPYDAVGELRQYHVGWGRRTNTNNGGWPAHDPRLERPTIDKMQPT